MSTEASLGQKLEILRKDYLKRLGVHLVEFGRFQELLISGINSAADLHKFYRLTHNFIGSGATFGFPEISRSARALHKAIGASMEVDDSGGRSRPEQLALAGALQEFIDICKQLIIEQRRG